MTSGIELKQKDELAIRSIAPPKKSLPRTDLLPFYNYIHIDMRNDWCTRNLKPGSPAGGDLATWWTSRRHLNKILTAKIRIDDPLLFSWEVNSVNIHPVNVKIIERNKIFCEIGLTGYSPYFKVFEVSIDDKPWQSSKNGIYKFSIDSGLHSLKARISTINNHSGPTSKIIFKYESNVPYNN